MILNKRTRRLRTSEGIRAMVSENAVTAKDLLAPLFIIEGNNKKVPILSMPGQSRFTLDLIFKEVEELLTLGVPSICLFPALPEEKKNTQCTEALNEKGLYLTALREIKKRFPELILMTDVALDPYSSDGHDGFVDPVSGEIVNDTTVEMLAKMSVLQAAQGADIIGPSDMMDGRVGAIRGALEKSGFSNTMIMSYTAKYASSFYGPFREALDSTPKKGDKKTYQMNPTNGREALRELRLDEEEGVDIVMVKPGLPYLDIVKTLRDNTHLPVAVYNVSGEYAMIKAAAQLGWLDGTKAMAEMLTSFKRAGADIILTYFAKEMAQLLRD
ncbi:MAG: delta-aminolevulinic acid dehydratase [Bdellovibrionales bacterium GWA2_49_15]|nr:MAG: delta-aminolevulinic acid dehydratase [Bdellovibrionales bacterium GWA2_49_15]HAZ14587.1 porphobilinogen synthase [Bdellovibrionales bacterium]